MEPTQTDIVYECIRVSGSINYGYSNRLYLCMLMIMSHLPHISSQGCGVCSAATAAARVCFVPPFLNAFEQNAAKKEYTKKKTKRISLLFGARVSDGFCLYIFYLFMLLLLLLTLLGLSHYFHVGFYL